MPEKEKKQGLNENEIAPEQEENAFGLTVDESRQAHLDFLTSLILIGVCIALIVLVPFSRMYLGVHTPLDVGVAFLMAAALLPSACR